jgi:Lrp/AsnC family transcriptional regulator, leucine-responsive regulatory protein
MDTLDLKILEALKENGRTTASEISKRVALSLPATAERIRKLEEAGVIEQYTVRLNRDKLNLKLLAFIFVNVSQCRCGAQFLCRRS